MNAGQVHIRAAIAADLEPLCDLSAELGYPGARESLPDLLPHLLSSDDHLLLVAESADGSVAGWLHLFIALRVESGAFAEIGGFVVTEKLRGLGIGRQLLSAAERWVCGRGLGTLRVRTRSKRQQARAFYQRLGFRNSKSQQVLDKHL